MMRSMYPDIRRSKTARVMAALFVSLALVGCKSLTDSNTVPGGYVNPDNYKTPSGAIGQYNAAVAQFEKGFISAASYSGLLSDELDAFNNLGDVYIDMRDFTTISRTPGTTFPAGEGAAAAPYGTLQATRSYVVQALGALSKYAPDASPTLRGRLYAYKGYTEVFLADLFCSGIPLSDLEFEGDFTYKPGSSTRDVYAHAIVLLDSALALAGANDSVANLARVGKARALLALDSVTAAAAIATAVPDNFLHQFGVEWVDGDGTGELQLTTQQPTAIRAEPLGSVSDRAGLNGLPYRSSGDPRTSASLYLLANNLVGAVYVPQKYGTLAPDPSVPSIFIGASSITLASGVEARLIQAEAALKAGQVSVWLDILNTLRTTGNIDGTSDVYSCPVDRDPNTGGCPVDSMFVRTDTLWQAGTGGVTGLRPLTDPGTTTARVDTMFAERAAWLFVDGHRQGDLRRLIRQYGRTQQQVYPTGINAGPQSGTASSMYGDAVVMPVPRTESTANPLYHGCIDRKA